VVNQEKLLIIGREDQPSAGNVAGQELKTRERLPGKRPVTTVFPLWG
jgi:hypothetical protein